LYDSIHDWLSEFQNDFDSRKPDCPHTGKLRRDGRPLDLFLHLGLRLRRYEVWVESVNRVLTLRSYRPA
jgi:hypothetical protein